jgi:hypothetical protein
MKSFSIRNQLVERGCLVGPRASELDLELLRRRLGQDLDPTILDLYRTFDGFEDSAEASWITGWTVQQVIHFKPEYTVARGYAAFCDVAINATIIHYCIADASKPVVDAVGQSIASSLIAFFDKLLDGSLDLR